MMRRLIISLLIVAFFFNLVTFGLFFISDFWQRPLSAQASSSGSVSLVILPQPSNSTNSTNDTGSGGGTGGGGGSGGGGGGSSARSSSGSSELSFSIDPEELTLFLVAGALEERTITITNTGVSALTLSAAVAGVSSFVALSESSISLAPGESRTLRVSIKGPDSGIYGGRITFASGEVRKDVILLVNIRSANALFDVSLTIPESHKRLALGRILKAFIALLQVGPAADTDVTVHYLIKDFDGATLLSESETFRVLRSKDYVREFKTDGLPAGDYLAGIEVSYPQGFATSSAHFTVVSSTIDLKIVSLITLLVVSLAVLFYSFRTYQKAKQLRGRGSLKR